MTETREQETSQRTDVRVDLYRDDEGLYDVTVTFSETGERVIVDPRMVFSHRTA